MVGRGVLLALAALALAGCVSDSTGIGYAGWCKSSVRCEPDNRASWILQEKYSGFADGAVVVAD